MTVFMTTNSITQPRLIATPKQGSKRSVSSESSESKLSGAIGFETEFDIDKHRDYDIRQPRRSYNDCATTRASMVHDESNMSDEQRAWAGIDAILDDDDESLDPENVLSKEIIAALRQTPPRPRIEDNGEDDNSTSSEDSHDHALKVFCGIKSGESVEDLPNLMNSSFSSQFSHESARSVFSFLSKHNIIVQRDIKNGPLKNFLADMAYNLEKEEPIEEDFESSEHGESIAENVDNDDDEHADDGKGSSNVDSAIIAAKQEQGKIKDEVLDPIGQQIINAIMTEMKRMKETNEYDEDSHRGSEEAEEYAEIILVHKELQQTSKSFATRQGTRENELKSRLKPQKSAGLRDTKESAEHVVTPEDDLNNSIPSLDTFQDDEVYKILDHQNPMAWASFGDLHFDSNHVCEEPTLPQTPLYNGETEDHSSPSPTSHFPIKCLRNEIVSGIVSPPTGRKDPSVPTNVSPSKGKRRLTCKQKATTSAGIPNSQNDSQSPRQSLRKNGTPSSSIQHSTSRSKNSCATPKVIRKPTSKAEGATQTPRVLRKSIKRPDGVTKTQKKTPKSQMPSTMLKLVEPAISRPSSTQVQCQKKKPDARQGAKRSISSKGGTLSKTSELGNEGRCSVVGKGRQETEPKLSRPELRQVERGPAKSVRTPLPARKKKITGN